MDQRFTPWQPDGREKFEYPLPETKARELFVTRQQEFLQYLVLLQEKMHRGEIGLAKLGALLNKSLIKLLQLVPPIEERQSAPWRNIVIGGIRRDIETLYNAFGEKYGREVANGFMAEAAIAKVLADTKRLYYDVYFPSEDPQNFEEHDAIDWWIMLDTLHLGLALQVKSGPFTSRLKCPVFSFESLDELEDIIKTASMSLPSQYGDVSFFQQRCRDSGSRLLSAVVRRRHGHQRVAPAMAFISTPGSEYSEIGPMGELIQTSSLPTRLNEGIEAIIERYENGLKPRN